MNISISILILMDFFIPSPWVFVTRNKVQFGRENIQDSQYLILRLDIKL